MSRIVVSPTLVAELEAQEEYRAAMRHRAEMVRAEADQLAESIPDHGAWMPRHGHEQFEVQEFDGSPNVVNTDYAGHLVEWGSRNNPPYAPLQRAARAVGLKLG